MSQETEGLDLPIPLKPPGFEFHINLQNITRNTDERVQKGREGMGLAFVN